MLLACFVTGLGQAYFGYWRRAVLWATVPLLLDLAFAALVVRFELRALYSWFIVVAVSAWILPRILAFVEVRSLAERRQSGAVGVLRLLLFSLGALGFAFAYAMFEGSRVAEVGLVRSNAMRPTLLKQERLVIDPTAYRSREVTRGELAVLDTSDGVRAGVSRVIGLPGDYIELTDGELRVNGWPVPRCVLGQVTLSDSHVGVIHLEFLGANAYLTLWNVARTAPSAWTVAPGEASLLSDNRNDSADVSGAEIRRVRAELVKGRPLFVFFGLKQDESVDWSRFGLALDRPQLPNGLEALEPRLRQCLAARPPRDRTEPPRQ